MHASREKEVSVSRFHPTLQQGLYLSSPVPTFPCELKDFALLPVQFVDTDMNYGFLLFCLVRNILNGASDHWKQKKGRKEELPKTPLEEPGPNSAPCNQAVQGELISLQQTQFWSFVIFRVKFLSVTSSIYLYFFTVYVCKLSIKQHPHIKFKHKNNYIRKRASVMIKSSNKIHA